MQKQEADHEERDQDECHDDRQADEKIEHAPYYRFDPGRVSGWEREVLDAMNRCLHLICSFAILSGLAGTAASAQTKPIRHLVYTFDISITTDLTVHSSGVDANGSNTGSGMTHYPGGNSDKGSITVDVLGVQPDTGLVVSISEEGRGTRSAEAAMCVAYGIGSVVCDPNKTVNEEEMSLLRVIGRNFVNMSAMDAKRHWQNTETMQGGTETSDYTITHDDNNGSLGIDYQRILKVEGANGYRADTQGNIAYSQKLSVPTQVKEDTVTRTHVGQGQDNRTEQQLTLTLSTDSLAQTATTP